MGTSYIFRSILHSTLISLAALPDEELLEAELNDASDELDDDAVVLVNPSVQVYFPRLAPEPFYPSLPLHYLHSKTSEPSAYRTIFSLILTSGRLISDRELRGALRKLHLPMGASVPLGRNAHNHPSGTGGN
ncbi:hypothetical protein F5051DRAFT_445557 [Lentinula edodes]|nr:hypothetical protein F5051DRAFT_445557 [Lentinula edodes]